MSLGLRAVLAAVALAAASLAGSVDGQGSSATSRLALVGGMLLDGWGGVPVQEGAVLIEGTRIVAAGPASDVHVPPDARVIDTSGRTMMPGLIEAHAHLFILGHGDYRRWFDFITKNNLKERVMEISARQLLNAGVTTAIGVGDPQPESLRVRERVNGGELTGPRLFLAGRMITRRPAGAPTSMVDEVGLTLPVDTPEDAARAVGVLAGAGVDLIKAQSGMTAAHYRAIVEAAHRRKLKVHAHVYAEEEVRDAFEAGVDVLQHVGSGGTTPPYSPELVQRIARSGRPIVDTIAHRSWVYPATAAYETRLRDPQLRQDFGAAIYDEVQASFKSWHTLGYFNRIDSELFFREKVAQQWIESGAVMGMGTDSGTPLNFHTEALWREMHAHVEMGMDPSRVIVAATRINAARVLGRSDLGTIAPGKLADVIVIDGNPLFDMSALARVDIVVKDGKVLKGAAPSLQTLR